MFNSLHIRGFQSLYEVDLDLAPFTVLVGPSNSGKSAVVRALYTLVKNPRTVGDITSDGCSATAIKVIDVMGRSVTYHRDSKGTRYQLDSEVYTKLAGTVPADIEAVLNVSDLAFSSQFALPFLLDESGAVVARRFGELTNVTTLFEAAREGNRRRSSHRAALKTRESDLAKVQSKLSDYTGLKEKLSNQDRAESLLREAQLLGTDCERIATLVRDLGTAVETLSQATRKSVELPDLTSAETQLKQIERLEKLMSELRESVTVVRDSDAESAKLREEKKASDESYAKELSDMGTCPTCNQRTDGEQEPAS